MSTLWEVGDSSDPYADRGFAQLSEHNDGGFRFTVHDGAKGADFQLTAEQLLGLAYTIYEELG